MKKLNKRILVWFLTLAMLIPVLSAAAAPAFAATTSGTLKNVDPELITGLIAPSEEATINMENGGGIRFATNINLKKLEDLKAFCKKRRIDIITIGTLIAPADYVQEAGEFSKEKLDALGYKTPYLDVKSSLETFYKGERFILQGYDEQFVASLMNIKVNNLDRDFAAIGYVQLTLAQGVYTIYSYDNEDMALVKKYATSIADLAAKELEKDTWSDDERAMISDLAAKVDEVEITSDEVADVLTTRNQMFFTYTKGSTAFYNRLTYDGANGWRLQSNLQSYNHFKDISAGQSLAMYMNEGFNDVTVPLTVTQEEGKLVIKAAGTEAHAVLSYDAFNLDFCNAEGESLYNVNGLSLLSDGKIQMTGRMNQTDAVYGGGETFTDANKRGQTVKLYISDAYNANGTYVAIPLFSTSRGGGMFVNRYEYMTVSFPQQGINGDWSLAMDSELFDGYFYATGKIADVLQAYTNLTGHASLPEEWAQGYLVCRYAPDFNSLNDINGEPNGVYWRTEFPNPENYYYTPHLPLTEAAAAKLKNNATIQSKDGKTTYYTYSNGVFHDVNSRRTYTYAQLPNKEDCYYDDPTKVSLAENPDALCHKKTVSYGSNIYHYIIESETDDFNYNGVTGETYFLRVGSRGGPGGAGAIYIVESLIEAGMKPTGVVLEGLQWYNVATDTNQKTNLKNYIAYLNSKNIKTLVYMSLGYLTGSPMGKNYKNEYRLSVNLWEYDPVTGEKGELIAENVTNIPKSDETENPDTTSDGSQIYLDITNPDAVKWYVDTVWDAMIELGVDGVKIDFCESVPNQGYYKKIFINKQQKSGYLEYNWHDPSVFENAEVHHAYPSYFASVFYKAMEEKAAQRDGDTGFVLLTRGGGIGAQRNPYLWAGDQERRFQSLSTQLAAVINSGISGIPFMTYDMGGYAYAGTAYHYYGGQLVTIDDSQGSFYLADQQAAEEYESEIFVRALQFTTFGNLIQTHGYVRHVYQMTEEAQQISALYSALHEELADYLQKLSKNACDTGMPMVRHMVLEYQNDANVTNIDDQFMYGDALLLAPVLTCNTKTNENGKTVLDYASTVTREVYLPAGEWIDLNTGETIVSTGQTIPVSANLAKIPAYLNTASADAEELQAIFSGETWSAIKALANPQ